MRNRSWWYVLAALVAACGDPTPSGTADAGTDTGLVTCQTDPLVHAYAAGLTAVSDDGQVRLQLLASDPAPPIAGVNIWTLRVLGADGKPLAGATLAVEPPYMPHHGHHASVLATPTANADGTWTVAPLQLAMAGVWQVEFMVHAAGSDHAVSFFFCIEG